jgi:hypothetical protein
LGKSGAFGRIIDVGRTRNSREEQGRWVDQGHLGGSGAFDTTRGNLGDQEHLGGSGAYWRMGGICNDQRQSGESRQLNQEIKSLGKKCP